MSGYKAVDIAIYIVNYSNEKDYGISNLKLQKLLYFVQAYFLIKSKGKRYCFDDKIEAWSLGPVVPAAYHEFKIYGGCNIPKIESYIFYDTENILNSGRREFDDSVIRDKDKSWIKEVVDSFHNYTATDLVSITHKQAPWLNAYRKNQNNEITIDSLKEYFVND